MLYDRYPGADILSQRGHWDDATRRVVLDRVHNIPAYHFFEPVEIETLEALCARVVPQAHRPPERVVPLAPWIDARCLQQNEDGFRFEDMPPNPLAWRWGLEGLDQTAHALFHTRFAHLSGEAQDAVLRAVQGGSPPGEAWTRMPAARWFIYTALRQITGSYYAHPYAWDEIGFGGPAYPRGYESLNFGAPEPWEAHEAPRAASVVAQREGE
jgi:hypothetical protein